MKSFLVWIEKKSETETISCENTHTHTFITCIHMTLLIWFNLVFYIHSRVMCCACATSKRIFVHFVFHSVHCLMLLLFQFCYSECCFYAVNSTPTGYIFIEYKSYEKKHGEKKREKNSTIKYPNINHCCASHSKVKIYFLAVHVFADSIIHSVWSKKSRVEENQDGMGARKRKRKQR